MQAISKRRKRAAVEKMKEVDPCTDEAGLALGQQKCAIINDPEGPFAVCRDKNKNRQKMYDACVNDVCYNVTFLETHMEQYHASCGESGEPGDWRSIMNFRTSLQIL